MQLTVNDPPRTFEVGLGERLEMRDCAHIVLDANEQITLTTDSGAEYDVARKSWGFYATPSLNSRLLRFQLRGVLVKNRLDHFFVMLVEQGHEPEFEHYLTVEGLKVVCWLDSTEALQRLEAGLGG